jgi:geranylgeranyl pyrophosphate synthase
LPRLCCQAAGGHPEWAEDLTVAWLLYYAASDLMDSVQDADETHVWWAEYGPGIALSTASGLYFSASLALNNLHARAETSPIAATIAEEFYGGLLVMGSGQHKELLNKRANLEDYWQQVEAKSGVFFAVACRSGARLALADEKLLAHYSLFGQHLGILIQIKDDLEAYQRQNQSADENWFVDISRSLPAVYALEVSESPYKERLQAYLSGTLSKANSAKEAISLIDQSGASIYILAEVERHQRLAIEVLEKAQPLSPHGDELKEMIRAI